MDHHTQTWFQFSIKCIANIYKKWQLLCNKITCVDQIDNHPRCIASYELLKKNGFQYKKMRECAYIYERSTELRSRNLSPFKENTPALRVSNWSDIKSQNPLQTNKIKKRSQIWSIVTLIWKRKGKF